MTTVSFSAQDIAELSARGINEEEARRQISLIAEPPDLTHLHKASTIGDGIHLISPDIAPKLLEYHRTASESGRFSKFVPSSGAATRMFRELIACREASGRISLEQHKTFAREGRSESKALLKFLDGIEQFAFTTDLEAAVRKVSGDGQKSLRDNVNAGNYLQILDALLSSKDGLQYGDLPKGLLKFHIDDGVARTPFEEHLMEAIEICRDSKGITRLHFTVSPDHRARFTLLYEQVKQALESNLKARYAVSFSVQKPSTDTVALDLNHHIFRDKYGKIVFRPGGHGALIENLNDLEGDLVFIKNIDNVQPVSTCQTGYHWRKLLGGLLALKQQEAFALIAELKDPLSNNADHSTLFDRAVEFLRDSLNVPIPESVWNSLSDIEERRSLLLGKLNRPMRVCGVVKNTGEPGGGPFWVRNNDGFLSLQIVEGAQIDRSAPAQDRIFKSSTHFNPVDMVCGLRDFRGRPFDLSRYTDPLAVILARKSHEGRDLLALERPGLWNGAMANWITIFVEIPSETFTPVKSVLDLLRPEHKSVK